MGHRAMFGILVDCIIFSWVFVVSIAIIEFFFFGFEERIVENT